MEPTEEHRIRLGHKAEKKLEVATLPKRDPADVEARIFRAHPISTEGRDRDGDILRSEGADASAFALNPVGLYMHDRWSLPTHKTIKLYIGTAGKNKAVLADYQYPEAGVLELADKVHDMDAGGFLRAASVGFLPTSLEAIDLDGEPVDMDQRGAWLMVAGYDVTEWELMEWSKVTVPSNRESARRALEDVTFNKAWLGKGPGSLLEWVKDGPRCEVELDGKPRGREMIAVLDDIKNAIKAAGSNSAAAEDLATIVKQVKGNTSALEMALLPFSDESTDESAEVQPELFAVEELDEPGSTEELDTTEDAATEPLSASDDSEASTEPAGNVDAVEEPAETLDSESESEDGTTDEIQLALSEILAKLPSVVDNTARALGLAVQEVDNA